MHLLDLTLPTPEENLALDEALLTDSGDETLRYWEAPAPMIVLGRSSQVEQEVDVEACKQSGLPILRRVSGGATIVTGPGCLMYAVTLNLEKRPELRSVDHAHAFVLGQIAESLRQIERSVSPAGISDLAYRSQGSTKLCKFSGNSVRLVRSRLLYHGTLLYDFDLSLIDQLLRTPPRQPDYREGRTHQEFVENLPCEANELRSALTAAWKAKPTVLTSKLSATIDRLVREKYSLAEWNLAR